MDNEEPIYTIDIRPRRTGLTYSQNSTLADCLKAGTKCWIVTKTPKKTEKELLRDFDLLVILEPVVETDPLRILSNRKRNFKNYYSIKLIA